jgi:N-hydroxyarylamine O-acetyltransferase
MDVDAYLRRIGFRQQAGTPDAATLVSLHRAHMLAVPFENLDIHLGREIILDEARLFDKIVRQRRGGFCYELNGLFGALLREIGFDVTLVAAEVVAADGSTGPPFDHMALLVEAHGVRYLADVGFGDLFMEPLLLDERGVQHQGPNAFSISETAVGLTLMKRKGPEAGALQPCYQFSVTPRQLRDFEAMCHFHQTSPDSHFTRKEICSMATADGRVTISGAELIITSAGARTVTPAGTGEARKRLLKDYFGIE